MWGRRGRRLSPAHSLGFSCCAAEQGNFTGQLHWKLLAVRGSSCLFHWSWLMPTGPSCWSEQSQPVPWLVLAAAHGLELASQAGQ